MCICIVLVYSTLLPATYSMTIFFTNKNKLLLHNEKKTKKKPILVYECSFYFIHFYISKTSSNCEIVFFHTTLHVSYCTVVTHVCQKSSDVLITYSFLLYVHITDDEGEKPEFEKTDINIDEDLEMYSKFLERKVSVYIKSCSYKKY